MEFTLYYRGLDLKSATHKNKRLKEKHKLRKHFHKQLKELWQQSPLSDFPEFLQPDKEIATGIGDDPHGSFLSFENVTLLRPRGKFQFVPTISEDLDMVAELTITLLRPGAPGRIVDDQTGDLDNRLKMLFDALKVPKEDELPSDATPCGDETPFFCLVEDDALITSLDIRTDRLLEPVNDTSMAVLLLHVRTKIMKGNLANLGLV